jgi:hypothetical protein
LAADVTPVIQPLSVESAARRATAGLVGIEYLIVRKFPRTARVFSKINWSASIVTTGFAAHNFSIR